MKRHFIAWSRALLRSPGTWIGPAIAAPVLACAAAGLAGISAPGSFAACVAAVLGLAATLAQPWVRAGSVTRAMLGLAAAALLQFALAASAVRGGPLVGSVASVFLVTLGGLYGLQLRVSLPYPYGALPGGLALIAAAALARSPGELGALAAAGLAALGATFGVGMLRQRLGLVRNENEALRAAIHAQVLQRETRDDGRFAAQMRDLLETAHAASRSTTGALLDFELLGGSEGTRVSARSSALREAQGMSAEVGKILSRISEAFEGRRDVASDDGPAVERVDVAAAARRACAAIGAAHPGVQLVFDDGGADDLRVAVRDGERAFGAVLRHVIANACEGDGGTVPSRVEVRLARWGGNGVVVECSDDGPGFPYVQLRAGSPFRTTKRGHLGLGLYVAETLLAASGGTLQRANLPGTGALVRLHLRRR